MQVYHLAAPSALMQVVDVLSDYSKRWDVPRHRRNGPVRRVRLRSEYGSAAPLVPAPDERRVSVKRIRRRQLGGVEVRPESSLRVAEGWHAALGGNACAREDNDAIRASHRCEQFFADHSNAPRTGLLTWVRVSQFA